MLSLLSAPIFYNAMRYDLGLCPHFPVEACGALTGKAEKTGALEIPRVLVCRIRKLSIPQSLRIESVFVFAASSSVCVLAPQTILPDGGAETLCISCVGLLFR